MPRRRPQRAVVRRRLDEQPAFGSEVPDHEIEALERAVRDHDLTRRHAVPLCQPLPQGAVPTGRPVVERRLTVPLEDGSRAIRELADRQALRRRHPARERDHLAISATSWAVSVGVVPTRMPQDSSTSFFAWAVPDEPEMIAPAWPIVFPGGAVKPAM